MSPAEVLALNIIENGTVFAEHWYDDGDMESGPSGGTLYGYRHGEYELCLSRNGSVFLQGGVGIMPTTVHSSAMIKYTGIGKMIADHLRAIESNAGRNGVDFVNTGRR